MVFIVLLGLNGQNNEGRSLFDKRSTNRKNGGQTPNEKSFRTTGDGLWEVRIVWLKKMTTAGQLNGSQAEKGGGHPLPTPHHPRRLRRLDLRAFGAQTRRSQSSFFRKRSLSKNVCVWTGFMQLSFPIPYTYPILSNSPSLAPRHLLHEYIITVRNFFSEAL